MEQEDMNKANVIAILTLVLKIAEAHGEDHTAKAIREVLAEIEK